MIVLLARVAVLAVVFLAAMWLVRLGERRRGRTDAGLAPGLTLITGADCALCGPAEQALLAAGAAPRVLSVEQAGAGVGATSLPVAVVVDGRGEVRLRRSGRSVITDAPRIAAELATVS